MSILPERITHPADVDASAGIFFTFYSPCRKSLMVLMNISGWSTKVI